METVIGLLVIQVGLLGVIVVSQHKFTAAMELLEKNTNSIKDALIKTIGESEFAKGVLQENEKWTKNWTPVKKD